MPGLPQRGFLSINFLPVNGTFFPVSFYALFCFVLPCFLLKTRHFEYFNTVTLEMRILPPLQ